ncbi:MAG: ATP-binding cassette domain-containing protein [Steroidobacteraceae bacterium]
MLLRLDKVSLSYGSRPLLDQVSLQLDEGERLALVGRNGEGKSSLLQLLRGAAEPDQGSVWVRPSARVAYLVQDISALQDESVAELVAGGLPAGADTVEGWQPQQQLAAVLSRLHLQPEARVTQLSGGMRRRALLARALVSDPEVLLLDEPTNHLDIDTIEWLERQLGAYRGALLFVSHDRVFINRLATGILELDRGVLTATAGNYEAYLLAKARQLQIEREHQALFDKKLAQEEAWIRRGVEARRTRNEGRVRALMALRAQRRARRERSWRVELPQAAASESAGLVFEAEQLSVELAGRVIVRDFSARIMRGDRIGLIGPNGVGKTTLIRALLGELPPSGGRVRRGSRLEIAYYDQERAQLDLDQSVMQNVAGRNDQVIVNGRSRHVAGYLRDFLFRPEQLNTPARALSGGERNRLLLARLFARPANLLVMDEPTNDLDIDTLELLEEYVADFPGTLLLVSHDRAFLDHVVTSLLVFEGDGVVRDFVGGHSDWSSYRARRLQAASAPVASTARAAPAHGARAAGPAPRRLSYKEQRELAGLPERLQQLEGDRQRLEAELADPALYRGTQDAPQERLQQLAAVTAQIDAAYARWSELDALAGGS